MAIAVSSKIIYGLYLYKSGGHFWVNIKPMNHLAVLQSYYRRAELSERTDSKDGIKEIGYRWGVSPLLIMSYHHRLHGFYLEGIWYACRIPWKQLSITATATVAGPGEDVWHPYRCECHD